MCCPWTLKSDEFLDVPSCNIGVFWLCMCVSVAEVRLWHVVVLSLSHHHNNNGESHLFIPFLFCLV